MNSETVNPGEIPEVQEEAFPKGKRRKLRRLADDEVAPSENIQPNLTAEPNADFNESKGDHLMDMVGENKEQEEPATKEEQPGLTPEEKKREAKERMKARLAKLIQEAASRKKVESEIKPQESEESAQIPFEPAREMVLEPTTEQKDANLAVDQKMEDKKETEENKMTIEETKKMAGEPSEDEELSQIPEDDVVPPANLPNTIDDVEDVNISKFMHKKSKCANKLFGEIEDSRALNDIVEDEYLRGETLDFEKNKYDPAVVN